MLNKKELAAVIAVLLVLGSLLSVAISRAQTAARKMQSQNNLKQIGLAVQNFASTFKKLPSGCDDQAKHGWMSFIFPYIEASSWYESVDFDISWEHSLNRQQFSIGISSYRNPGHKLNYTKEGFGITGYHANPALMHRGSAIKLTSLSAGLSNIWLAGTPLFAPPSEASTLHFSNGRPPLARLFYDCHVYYASNACRVLRPLARAQVEPNFSA